MRPSAGRRGRFVVVGHKLGAQVAELVGPPAARNTAGLVLVTPIPLKGFPLSAEQAIAFEQRGPQRDPTVAAAGRKALMVSPSPEAIGAIVAGHPTSRQRPRSKPSMRGPPATRLVPNPPDTAPTLNIPTTKEKS